MGEIHLSKDGVASGPFTEREVRALLRDKEFSPVDHYWREGMAEWQPLGKLELGEIPIAAAAPVAAGPRVLPLGVAIVARLIVIGGVWDIINHAILPWLTLIPGFSILTLPNHPEIHISKIPLIMTFISMPWTEWLLWGGEILTDIGIAVAILRGWYWARILFVVWTFGFLIRHFCNHDATLPMRFFLAWLPFASAQIFFLFNPAANRFFSERGPIEKPRVFGYGPLICFNVVSKALLCIGLLISMAIFRPSLFPSGSLNFNDSIYFFWFVLVPFLVLIFALYFGLKINRFYAWKRTIAVILAITLLPQMIDQAKRAGMARPLPAHSATDGS